MSPTFDAFGLIAEFDVPGAPVKIGQAVTVSKTASSDTLDPIFRGREGVVRALVYDDPARQYPADPLIEVEFAGLGADLFFAGELDLPNRNRVRRVVGSLSMFRTLEVNPQGQR